MEFENLLFDFTSFAVRNLFRTELHNSHQNKDIGLIHKLKLTICYIILLMLQMLRNVLYFLCLYIVMLPLQKQNKKNNFCSLMIPVIQADYC